MSVRTSGSKINHLPFECELLKKERNDLTTTILKTDVWPTSKPEQIKKHYKAFFKFTNAILIDKLTNPKPNGDSYTLNTKCL